MNARSSSNNLGFSGGAVVFGNGDAQQVIAVVPGFQTEPIDVVPVSAIKSKTVDSVTPTQAAIANSGFILAFSIQFALDAIKKNPIGTADSQRAQLPALGVKP